MFIERDCVVLAKAGREKGELLLVLWVSDGCAFIADGKSRLISKPKRKNLIHLQRTNYKIATSELTSDRMLRRTLSELSKGTAMERGE